MGEFSWKCKGCQGELICTEFVRIDDHVGTYNGYGVVVMDVGSNADGSDTNAWDVFDRSNPNETFTRSPNAWHEACHEELLLADANFEDDRPPSEHAPNQGFGAPQERFLPPQASRTSAWHSDFAWKLDGDDEGCS